MNYTERSPWLVSVQDTVKGYHRMIHGLVTQLTDDELFARPADNVNSVAVILRHLGGNLRSRWTDFMTTDGEKPDRHRDSEFEAWEGDRQSLLEYFEHGWRQLESALNSVTDDNVREVIYIRGEPHTVAQAIVRSVTHLSYHVGQIAMVARMVHQGEWQWLTVPPGASTQHNSRTWGSAASRSLLGSDEDAR